MPADDTLPLFLNPTAGRGRAGRRLRTIASLLGAGGRALDVRPSRAVGDLEDQVRRSVAGGAREIVVAGGDGSIHEAVNGIMAAGGGAALGVVPSGTGNDFAKACGIPLDWRAAARELAARLAAGDRLGRIDLGKFNERYFANGAGVGFDARVTAVARSIRWPIGDLVYLLAIIRCLREGVATPQVEISGDYEWRGPITLANVSNGPWIGGMFHIAPMAKNTDGKLELLVAAPVTRRRILALLPKLMSGRHVAEPELHHASASRLVIEAAAPLPAHLDGEVHPPGSRFEVTVLPDCLELL
jgi:diacylglycerol kinase (ATP)